MSQEERYVDMLPGLLNSEVQFNLIVFKLYFFTFNINQEKALRNVRHVFNNVKLLRLKRWARVASSVLADRDAN